MSRYINIDKALGELGLNHNDYVYVDKNEVAERIRKIPSIDIEPKRGEWIEFDTKWGRSLYYCTNCMETSEVPTAFGKPLYDFCPNCGADMRKESDR